MPAWCALSIWKKQRKDKGIVQPMCIGHAHEWAHGMWAKNNVWPNSITPWLRIEHADVVGDGAAHLIGMRAITRAPTRKISGFLRVTCTCENSVISEECEYS